MDAFVHLVLMFHSPYTKGGEQPIKQREKEKERERGRERGRRERGEEGEKGGGGEQTIEKNVK